MKRHVVIYARFSTDKQDARSIDDQIRRCHRFADERGYKVVRIYSDAAQSGGHVARAQLKRLLADARERTFDAVLVDDQSRLARDLGSSIGLIFTELPALRVALIDCATGRASDEKGTRTLFAVNAIVNDAFLEMVKHETHRGMEGRALQGFATGGRTFGYDTRPEENPTDPDRPRFVYVINEAEAKIVDRIFRMWIERTMSAKAIAFQLNAEHVPAPHDGGKGNKGNRGWVPGTILNILKNERYVGTWIWNQREYTKNPKTGKRTAVMRPREQWTIMQRPELAIVDRATFNAAQQRMKKIRETRQSQVRSRGTLIVAGLLRCGLCGGSLTTIGGTKKPDGRYYRKLGCTTHWSRGASVCANGLTISEMKATASVMGKVLEALADPATVETVIKAFQARVAEANREAEESETDKRKAQAETELRNLLGALAKMGYSQALQNAISEKEAEISELKKQLASERAGTGRGRAVAQHPNALRHYVSGYLQRLTEALKQDDKQRVRALLLEHVGPLTWTPVDGRYEWTGGLIFDASISTTAPEESPGSVVRSTGSGGRI